MLNFFRKIKSNNLSFTFIGMPGCGKSYLSKQLNQIYNLNVIELDEEIENKYNKTLFELLDIYGEKKFKQIEEDQIKNINFSKQQIISTGGSVIYCEDGMNHLQNNNNLIIFLNTPFEILQKRTENFTNRGIVFNGLTPYQLFEERYQLYDYYSDIKLNTTEKNLNALKENLIYLI